MFTKKFQNFFLIFCLAFAAAGLYFVLPHIASAQVDVGLTQVGTASGLGTTDIRVTIANIIRIFLGFLGAIAVVLILYGGFLWMTAGGNEEKISAAKQVLVNTSIGLAVILASFAITSFILSRLTGATGGTGGTGGDGRKDGGGDTVLSSNVFSVRSFTPAGSVPIRNITVRALLSRSIDAATVKDNFFVSESQSGVAVAGDAKVEGNVIVFEPSAPCPAPNTVRRCFGENTEYKVELKTGLKSADGKALVCGGLAKNCVNFFTTGSQIDTAAPNISLTYPDEGQPVSVNDVLPVSARATDDAGVGLVNFSADGATFGFDAPSGNTMKDFLAAADWNTSGLVLQSRHTLRAAAFDIDSNTAQSSEVQVVVRPEHCFNGISDGGEVGVDCGGTGVEACGACDGARCGSNFDCAGGVCRNGACITLPKILSVTPENGKPGNYITIFGETFGAAKGEVIFLGDPNVASDDVVASLAVCGGAWNNTIAVVEIPENAKSGPLLIRTPDGREDRTNDAFGPVIADFLVNDIARPGLCEVRPKEGAVGTEFETTGKGLGAARGGSKLFLGDAELSNIIRWTETSVRSVVPNTVLGKQFIVAEVGGRASNPLPFVVRSSVGIGPNILFVNPSSGAPGHYITLTGERFGSATGIAYFIKKDDPTTVIPADVNFPEQCQENFWKDRTIVVKVPAKLSNGQNIEIGSYAIRIVAGSGAESNEVDFSVNNSPMTPGICAIVPDNGPAGTRVSLYGNAFGDTKGEVKFWENVPAGSFETVWGNVIQTSVPAAAKTGPVTVSAGPQAESNGVPFEVGRCSANSCGAGEECCGDGSCRAAGACFEDIVSKKYTWLFSTGELPVVPYVVEECGDKILPSPSPWGARPNGGAVCKNAAIEVRFNTLMNLSTITSASLKVEECTGSETDAQGRAQNPCVLVNEVFGNAIREHALVSNGAHESHAIQVHPGGLKADTRYRVTLSRAIESAETATGERGVSLLQISASQAERCGYSVSQAKDIGYCFTFKTSDALCSLATVLVEPNRFTITDADPRRYVATGLPETAACWILDGESYNWNWSSSDDARAVVSKNDADGDGRIDFKQNVTPIAETIPGAPVKIRAQADASQGEAELTIAFTDPKVTQRFPDCASALSCAEAGARFNIAMKKETVESGVTLGKCGDETCRDYELVPVSVSYSDIGSGDAVLHEVTLHPLNGDLETGRWYRVLLNAGVGGIVSETGKPLSGANYGNFYSWTFRVSEKKDQCTLDRIETLPKHSDLTIIGQTQELRVVGYGVPDDCSTNGQRLSLLNADGTDRFSWNWASSKNEVATLASNDAPWNGVLLDANPKAGGFCSNQCLNTGTRSGVSVCGNGKKGLGEDCDDGNAQNGDGCSSSCLHEGSGSPQCGNGRFDAGEDCDDSNAQNGDGCSAECLNEGAALPGAYCGNGIIDAGEDCDDGGLAIGDGCNNRCLDEGASDTYGSQCGNGLIEKGENCDDGNTVSGDGCGNTCLKEGSRAIACARYPNETLCNGAKTYCFWNDVGGKCEYNNSCNAQLEGKCILSTACVWRPTGTSSGVCEKVTCGDGVREYAEACDDGNAQNGDGCSIRCLNEGTSSGSGSMCGNGDRGPGEDCDDGNTISGDGCSAKCLNEGTIAGIGSCGNGIVENGENCDGGDGCNAQCLNTGSAVPAVCGDGFIGDSKWAVTHDDFVRGKNIPLGFLPFGEDCDDSNTRNGDGCSTKCLSEGASPAYGSVCGDETIGTGEECESGGPDTQTDARQYVKAASAGATTVNAGTEGVACTGEDCTEVRVFCQYENDAACRTEAVLLGYDPKTVAHGANNCCYIRPSVLKTIPTNPSDSVCRNGLLEIAFDTLLDPASITGNFELWKNNGAANCGAGTVSLWGKTKNFFQNVFAKIGLAQAPEDIWCPVAGQPFDFTVEKNEKEMTAVRFTQSDLLEAGTQYNLVVRGDNPATPNVEGVRSLVGQVGIQNDDAIHFHFNDGKNIIDSNDYAYRLRVTAKSLSLPNEGICKLERVVAVPSEKIFTESGASETFLVRANSAEEEEYLTPILGAYEWDIVSKVLDETLATIPVTDAATKENKCVNPAQCSIVATAQNKNGETELASTAIITKDVFFEPTTEKEMVEGGADIRNVICENPWSGSPSPDFLWNFDTNPITGGVVDPKMNFGFWYCRDAGTPGTKDDLPDLSPVQTQTTDAIRQLLLTDPDSRHAVGIKILANPKHLSLRAWYLDQGFKGNPASIAPVGGYEALRDGNTTYVAFGNDTTPGSGAANHIFTNVLVISYSEGATEAMVGIYHQILANIKFHTNLPLNASKNLKKDVKRFADLTDIAAALERYNNATGEYPKLEAGTFLRGMTVSAWPSWSAVFGTALGMNLPADPDNVFPNTQTRAFLSPSPVSGWNCAYSAANFGYVCTQSVNGCSEAGFQKETCFDSSKGFYCPFGSHLYWYNARGDGEYNLAAQFEYESNVLKWNGGIPLAYAGRMRLFLGGTSGALCAMGSESQAYKGVCGDGFSDVGEACDGAGGDACKTSDGRDGEQRFTCSADCKTKTYTNIAGGLPACEVSTTCGDGIVQAPEACDDGTRNGQYGYCNAACSGKGQFCGDAKVTPGSEVCDRGGKTEYDVSKTNSCRWDCQAYGPYCGDGITQGESGETCELGQTRTVTNGCGSEVKNGITYQKIQRQVCAGDCKGWTNVGVCANVNECGNGIVESGEQCDDGNTSPDDGCNACKLTSCGDGIIQKPNASGKVETCDLADKNGFRCMVPYSSNQTCIYCDTQCNAVTATAAFCGDGKVDASGAASASCKNTAECPWTDSFFNNITRALEPVIVTDGTRSTGEFCFEDKDCKESKAVCVSERPDKVGFCVSNDIVLSSCQISGTGAVANGRTNVPVSLWGKNICPQRAGVTDCLVGYGEPSIPKRKDLSFVLSGSSTAIKDAGTGNGFCISKYAGMTEDEFAQSLATDYNAAGQCLRACNGGVRDGKECSTDAYCPITEQCDTSEIKTALCDTGRRAYFKNIAIWGEKKTSCNECLNVTSACEAKDVCTLGVTKCNGNSKQTCISVQDPLDSKQYKQWDNGAFCGDGGCRGTADGNAECVATGELNSTCDASHSCQSGLSCVPGSSGSFCRAGSGGACGSDTDCVSGLACRNGTCQTAQIIPPTCTPNCTGKVCGEDGCGGSCGTCSPNATCVSNQCVLKTICIPTKTCVQLEAQCGSFDDGCGGTLNCGSCAAGQTCSDRGRCQTSNTCTNDSQCGQGQACIDGICQVGPEVCNGLDDNNNDQVDEGNPGVSEQPAPGTFCSVSGSAGICTEGKWQCTAGVYVCAPNQPIQENFSAGNCSNGLDDDCDGEMDAKDSSCEVIIGQQCRPLGSSCAYGGYPCCGGGSCLGGTCLIFQ